MKKEKIPLGKGYLKVHWQAFDNLHRKIIYETTVKGKTDWHRYRVFTKSGGSLNINFLIPIEEVFEALLIKHD